MTLRRALSVPLLAFSLSACVPNASAACATQSTDMGPDFRVAGSFATTVARVRGLLPAESQMIPLGIPGETSASLCYLDGPVSHGAPPVNGVVQPSFDRAAVVVVGD